MSTMSNIFTALILRSRSKVGVSKDGPDRRQCTWPSFETAASPPPQDEVRWLRALLGMGSE
jgi:hypothetical protein